MLDHWEAARRDGNAVRVLDDTQHLTLSIIGQALLSAEVGRDNTERFGAAVRDSLHLMRRRNTSWLQLPLWLPTRGNRHLHMTKGILDDYVNDHIGRRGDGTARQDILETMRRARDAESGTGLDHAALRDETKTLFVAGFETTATALAWALYALAQRPELAEQLNDELRQVLGGAAPDFDSIKRLPLTAAVVNETLRLYPPVYNVARQCVSDDEFGGRRIPRGAVLLLSVYGMQRDPALWHEPDSFRPQRFLDGNWPRHAFMPFAIGKHTCIGNHFAVTEMTVALAMIVQRYRLRPADAAPVGMVARITLAPDREIALTLEPR
jgi:cytochrome P450